MANGYTIISKDADFHQMSFLYCAPLKTIWPNIENSSTAEIEDLIKAYASRIFAL